MSEQTKVNKALTNKLKRYENRMKEIRDLAKKIYDNPDQRIPIEVYRILELSLRS